MEIRGPPRLKYLLTQSCAFTRHLGTERRSRPGLQLQVASPAASCGGEQALAQCHWPVHLCLRSVCAEANVPTHQAPNSDKDGGFLVSAQRPDEV